LANSGPSFGNEKGDLAMDAEYVQFEKMLRHLVWLHIKRNYPKRRLHGRLFTQHFHDLFSDATFAFVNALRSWDKDTSSLSTWVYNKVKWYLIDQARRAARHRKLMCEYHFVDVPIYDDPVVDATINEAWLQVTNNGDVEGKYYAHTCYGKRKSGENAMQNAYAVKYDLTKG
jgi:DNA-directed RNA polymerase specialized sigma24 family protein